MTDMLILSANTLRIGRSFQPCFQGLVVSRSTMFKGCINDLPSPYYSTQNRPAVLIPLLGLIRPDQLGWIYGRSLSENTKIILFFKSIHPLLDDLMMRPVQLSLHHSIQIYVLILINFKLRAGGAIAKFTNTPNWKNYKILLLWQNQDQEISLDILLWLNQEYLGKKNIH